MFEQPPFPRTATWAESARSGRDEATVAVVVPTRDRPERLERCLEALAGARNGIEFTAYICDSSRGDNAARVAELCRRHSFVELVRHDRIGATAARNVGVKACDAELVVSVDDDVYIAPDAIDALLRAYRRGRGKRVVAGSVDWGYWKSRPLVMRPIGVAREALPEEEVEFLLSALVLYPRELGLACPWNERLWPHDDRFASLLWRAAGADLLFAPDASARHDETQNDYPVDREADRIYVNLFDARFVTRSLRRALAFEVLGFAACAKKWARTPAGAWKLIVAWFHGHAAFIRDYRRLRDAVRAADMGIGGTRPRQPAH
jgi:glycosyltransferase involved in cell wall biosynthesis